MGKIKFNFEDPPMMSAQKHPLVKVGLYMYTLYDDEENYTFRAIINNKVLSKIIVHRQIVTKNFDYGDGDQVEVKFCELQHQYIVNDNNPDIRAELLSQHTVPVDSNCHFSTLLANTIKYEQENLNPY